MFDLSRMKLIFSSLQPDLRITCRRSLSNSLLLYLLCTLIWNTVRPFTQAANLESVVLLAPDTPMSRS